MDVGQRGLRQARTPGGARGTAKWARTDGRRCGPDSVALSSASPPSLPATTTRHLAPRFRAPPQQKAEFKPKQVSIPGGERNACPADAICAAGATSSFVSCAQGQTYYWGKLKVNSSNQMYPVAFMELSGWREAAFSC